MLKPSRVKLAYKRHKLEAETRDRVYYALHCVKATVWHLSPDRDNFKDSEWDGAVIMTGAQLRMFAKNYELFPADEIPSNLAEVACAVLRTPLFESIARRLQYGDSARLEFSDVVDGLVLRNL